MEEVEDKMTSPNKLLTAGLILGATMILVGAITYDPEVEVFPGRTMSRSQAEKTLAVLKDPATTPIAPGHRDQLSSHCPAIVEPSTSTKSFVPLQLALAPVRSRHRGRGLDTRRGGTSPSEISSARRMPRRPAVWPFGVASAGEGGRPPIG